MLQLRAGRTLVRIDPEGGGRVTRIAVAGRDLLTPAGLFVMAPWAGRTGFAWFEHGGSEHRLAVDHPPHAIHGTVRGVAWAVDGADEGSAHLSAPLGPGWPWPGRCEHVITADDDHVSLAAAVVAADDGLPFPAVLGWHPWFVKPSSVDLDAEALLDRDDDHLPTGRRSTPAPQPGTRPLDDCFVGVRWPVVLRWADGLVVAVDADGCDHVVLYDGQAGATCVEPQTGPPDALRTGDARLVAPGRPLLATMRLRWGAAALVPALTD